MGSTSWIGALLLVAVAAGAEGPPAGWARFDLPATGSYSWRYVPASLDRSGPAPVILFLHGAGSAPENYQNFVAGAAETAGCVLVLPKALGAGWGAVGDDATIAAALQTAGLDLQLDPARIGIAGHSAGGAYAYLSAYAGSIYSAVFTLSAPYYPVAALTDPSYKPPIHMYYGTTDPNYTGGAYAALKAQWDHLGVAWEEDVRSGFGHNTWPNAAMRDGFAFVVARRRPAASGSCVAAPDVLCLHGGRFRAEVTWDTLGASGAGSASGRGQVVPIAGAGAGDSGLFWFFGPDNWELMVKVLDGCAVNGRFWVFSAATTNVHYKLTVTDGASGHMAVYENPAGATAHAVTDTAALAVCP
jgi:predicted esterase